MASSSAVISDVSSLPRLTADQPVTAGSSALDKDAFLRLLTQQLQHQDPLNPMDSQAFVAQLAQFSSVEQLSNMSGKLDTLAIAAAANNQMNTTSLVGKEVRIQADKIGLTPGTPSTFQVSLEGATDDTVAVIADKNGKVVRTLQLGPRSAGDFSVSWNGLDDKGQALPAGEYTLALTGTKKDGTEVSSHATVRGTVSAVRFENGSTQLTVAGRQVNLSQVTEILAPQPTGA